MLLNNLLKKIINHSFDFQMNSEMFYFQYKSQMIRPLKGRFLFSTFSVILIC